LAFDSKDVAGVIEGLDVLRHRFAAMIDRGRRDYLPITTGKHADKAVEAVLEHFRDKDLREGYYVFFQELQDIYEILSPDAFLRPFLDDFNELLRMFHLLRAAYDRDKPLDKEFLRKTARLVQEHTETGAIEDPTKFHALNAGALDAIAKSQTSDTVKVFNLLKALANLVRDRSDENPYLISIGDRAEGIAQAFELRQMTTQQALDALQALVKDVGEAEKDRDATSLSPEGFAVFYILKNEGLRKPLDVAAAVEGAFQRHPHWQHSDRQAQELRRALYRALIDAGVEDVVELVQRVMRVLRREQP
jgi:type I restriction enzyme R subunit